MNRFPQTFRLLLVLLIPLLIIGGVVKLVTTDAYLGWEYGKESFPADAYGFSPAQRFRLASTNIHYVRAHTPADALSRETVSGSAAYTGRELEHMLDVRAVFQIVFQLWRASFIVFLAAAYILWRSGKLRVLASALREGGLLTAGIVLSIALVAIFAWQTWFEFFHKYLFEEGSWLFSYSDTLIRLFPVEFWFDATVTISLFSLIAGLLIALMGWYWPVARSKIPAGASTLLESS